MCRGVRNIHAPCHCRIPSAEMGGVRRRKNPSLLCPGEKRRREIKGKKSEQGKV